MPILYAQIKAPVVVRPTSAETRPAAPAPSAPVTSGSSADDVYLREKKERDDREAADAKADRQADDEASARERELDTERSGLLAPAASRSLGGNVAAENGAQNADGTIVREGGLDLAATATILEGYNDNVVQTVDNVADRIVRRRGSPFIGLDASLIAQYLGERSSQDFRLQVRGQHYTPFTHGYDFSDDGTVSAAYQGRFLLTPRTSLTLAAASTLSTLNSSRQSDGLVIVLDPTATRRTYTQTVASIAVEHELSETWRYVIDAGAGVQTLIYDAPILLASGARVIPRGLDYVQPRLDATLFHDFGYEDVGFLRASYQFLYTRLALDLASDPPRNSGPIYTHVSQLQTGWTHLLSTRVAATTTVGGVVATAASDDSSGTPVISPTALESLSYVTPTLFASASVGYTYGSVDPRIGFGNTLDFAANIAISPWERRKVLRNLSLLANGQITRSNLQAAADVTSVLATYAASVEARYGISSWLALMAGYSFRSASITNNDTVPPLWRSLVFIGLTGYLSTQKTMPPLVNFAPPITGG